MKTINFYLIILVCWSFQLQAQNNWTKEEVIKYTVNFDLYEDTFEVHSKSKSVIDQSIQITSVELKDKEIIISYTSLMPEGGKYFKSSINILLENKILEIEPEDLLGDVNKSISFSEDIQKHQIIWTNLVDRYIQLSGQLEINLNIEIQGTKELPYNVDCEIPPTFASKQKMPFLLAGVLGTGSLTVGLLLENQAQNDYINLYSIQKSEIAAEPFYQATNQKHHTALIMTYAGVSILAVDAVWYFIKQIRYKNQLDTYNEFCNPKNVLLEPHMFSNPQNITSLQPGFKLTYTF